MKNENSLKTQNKENLTQINLDFLNNIKSSLSDPIYSRIEKTKEKSEKEQPNSKRKLDLCIKQLSLAKIAVNIHNLDPLILIKAQLELASLYAFLLYNQQSFEHYRQALKTHSIHFKNKEEGLKFEIYSKLIESCYLLKSYNQTLAYIQNYSNLLNKAEVENISSLSIELIHAKTLYALNDFEKSEKQFLIALNMLNKEIDLIVKLNHKNSDFNRNNFIFEQKTKILDFLFKIKIKEDNLRREQLELTNQILELCEKVQNENIGNKDLLFEMKSKYVLKKIELIEEEAKNNKEQSGFIENREFIHVNNYLYKNNLFIDFIKYLLDIFHKQKNLISKNNNKILRKILNLCKNNLQKIMAAEKFNLALDLIKIIQILDGFFFGDFSKYKARNNYIEAFLIIKSGGDFHIEDLENLLKTVLKIARQFKMDLLYKNTKEFMKSMKNNEFPEFDYKILDKMN